VPSQKDSKVKPSRGDQNKFLKRLWFRLRASDYGTRVITSAVAAIVLCLLTTVQVTAAQTVPRDPVALVIEKDGRTNPDLQPYSEIMAGDACEVPDGSSLVFIDYRSCDRVTVSGMTVNFSSSGFSTSGGANRSEQRVACPQTLATDSGGDNSSVLMRGIGNKLPSIALRPTFVIISAPGRSFARLSVTNATGTLVDAELHGARFDWPPSILPLEAGAVYQLVLLPERADDHPLKLSFKAAEDSPAAPEAIVLIHADR
jgi:hypothetical protein